MRALVCAAGLAGTVLLAGCSRQTSANADARPVKIEARRDPDMLAPDHPERFPLVRVETLRVPDRLDANCTVAPDVERTVHVTSLAGGRVIEIRARLGDAVKQGQVLLVVHSPDLAAAISDYRKSQADEALTRKALERAGLLYSHGAAPQKDVEQAEAAEAKAKVDTASAADRIRLLGGSIERLSPVIEVKAPVSGVIVEQNTAGGEGVKSLDNSPSLFTIADLSRVWVLCDVYENDLGQVNVGDSAEVRLAAYSDRLLRGRVGNIGQVLDPAARTAKVRLELGNRGGLMRPGMFARAGFVSRAARERMVVPASAILRVRDRDWVFRSESEGRFRRLPVETGPAAAGGRQEILAGTLRPGDAVARNALELSNAVEPM
jgi:cobalt-zinc-cadmium efflux system membrane fusion protein